MNRFSVAALASLILASALGASPEEKPADPNAPVSYYEDVLPILQSKCHGCHQPAKAKGDYVMTAFDKLLAGGETKNVILPGNPDKSYFVEQIIPNEKGEAEMPSKDKALPADEIDLIKKWIAQGAKDDTPENARERFDTEHPPTYTRPPVVTSLDFSPDGTLLAIAGIHEVILQKVDPAGQFTPHARLIGLSERIESVCFSPDGASLAVTGGLPGRMGEVQIWDVKSLSLSRSVPVTFDTVYGASWSPDSTKVAFGCADKSVRAIDVKTGKQILFMASHNDWVLDTAFTTDGSHLISTSRDQSAKLTKVDEERFIDNITSITPGALKGGINAIAMSPGKDEFLVGGSDGAPQIYRVYRTSARKIGDNANLITKFPEMPGRIWSVDISPDGKHIAAVSSLNGAGAVYIYQVEGAKILHKFDVEASMFAVCFHSDGSKIAVSGQDGLIRILDVATGAVATSFIPVKIEAAPAGDGPGAAKSRDPNIASTGKPVPAVPADPLPAGRKLTSVSISPSEIKLDSPRAYAQILVTAHYENGDTADITRTATFAQSTPILAISARGLARPSAEGTADLTATFEGQTASAKVSGGGLQPPPPVDPAKPPSSSSPDWIRDVNPVIAKLGCNAGTCHGSKDGKDGFKLSLRGYDPIFDIRAFTDDHASRRANLASPDNSLMLLKATGAVPHEGGQRMTVTSDDYKTIHDWIAQGAVLNTATPKVESIALFPENPVVQNIGGLQQFRVIATYPGGQTRDVTGEAFLEVGNLEVAATDDFALVTALRRGEAPILARYEGAYASTIVTVMGDRTGFAWQDQPVFNEIDKFTAEKWKRMKTLPSELCSDTEFLRRVHLDLTGLPPTPEKVRAFIADQRDTRLKRDELVDQLVGSPEFVEFWTNKWADLLQVNRKFLGPEGASGLRAWIRNEVEQNTPYDAFARKIITASGSNKVNPPAAYFKVLRTPEDTMENTTHLFLGTRFNCNKCHDHPFERWTQDQYYETAAFFAQTELQKDPASGKNEIGKTAVESGKPLYEIIVDKKDGEMKHERTGAVAPAQFPYPVEHAEAKDSSRRERLAAWMTSPENPLFAKSYANRIWGYLFGVGIIEPIDDIRAGNPATNPELLNWLTAQFVEAKFDVRHLFRTICKSRTYQLSVRSNQWNEDDTINYAHATARRLPAEVLYDSIYAATGAKSAIPGVPAGTRAAAIPDAGVELPDGFLGNLGRPVRESACECERVSSLELGPIMALVSGPTVGDAISDPNNAIANLVKSEPDDRKLADEIFVRILNRPATEGELEAAIASFKAIPEEHAALVANYESFRDKLAEEVKQKAAARAVEIETAKVALGAAEKAFAESKVELEKNKKVAADALQMKIAEYEKAIPAQLAEWEKSGNYGTAWTVLKLEDLISTNGAKLEIKEDGSILVSGNQGKSQYTFSAEPGGTPITGIRLEALTDDSLPKKGPGRSTQNGNFVVSEFTVTQGDDKKRPVPLQNAQADFSQDNYGVATAIDGQAPENGNGWAISPRIGENRTALFETKEDITGRLHFVINQQYQDGQHTLGKFRISVTTDPRPHLIGLAQNISDVIQTPAEKRSPDQTKTLLDYFKGLDPELKKLQAELAEVQKPVPVPAQVTDARTALTQLETLPPVSPRLVNLEKDVALSESQTKNARLIAAQDLAWALVNSPAFLFNY